MVCATVTVRLLRLPDEFQCRWLEEKAGAAAAPAPTPEEDDAPATGGRGTGGGDAGLDLGVVASSPSDELYSSSVSASGERDRGDGLSECMAEGVTGRNGLARAVAVAAVVWVGLDRSLLEIGARPGD